MHLLTMPRPVDNGLPITTLVDYKSTSVKKGMRLSEFELDVMAHFWRDGELSAPQLFERMGDERGVTYSTVKTIVDRLEGKGAIARAASRGRTIVYAPAIKQERVRKPLVKAFVRRLFGDDLRPLFAQLIRDEKLSDEELEYLRRLVAETGERK
jgi:BlaI family transcriptional regulator, penicillinase repressor